MGTPEFAREFLEYVHSNSEFNIQAVFTQPPNKSDRGQKINKSPIHLISETLNLEIRTPSTLLNNNDEKFFLKSLNLDLAIVVAYGQIIPKEMLTLTKK